MLRLKQKSPITTSLLIVAVAVLLLSVGFTLYLFCFSEDDEVAYIKASSAPIKVRPKERGGRVVAGSENIVYDSLAKGKKTKRNIKLAPKPEEPIKIIYNLVSNNSSSFENSIDEILANLDEYEAEANKLETTEIAGFVLPAARGKQTKQAETINTKYNIITVPENLAKLEKFRPKPSKRNGYTIQLALAISGTEATNKWQAIKQKHPKVLQNIELKLRQVTDKKQRIYFLVTAGTFDSLQEASKACRQLKGLKQKCLVLK